MIIRKMIGVIATVYKSENGEERLGAVLVACHESGDLSVNPKDQPHILGRWGVVLTCMEAFLERFDILNEVYDKAKQKFPLEEIEIITIIHIISVLDPVFKVIELAKARAPGLVPLLMIEMINLRMGMLNPPLTCPYSTLLRCNRTN